MSKKHNYEEMFLVSAIKTCAEMMVESEIMKEDVRKTDSPLNYGQELFHEKRLEATRNAFKEWINLYLKENY